jgi:hypothetical protein
MRDFGSSDAVKAVLRHMNKTKPPGIVELRFVDGRFRTRRFQVLGVRPHTSHAKHFDSRIRPRFGLIIAGFAALQVAPPASSQTGPDWVQLFDGRSLNGWDQVGTANWVEDGAIMADKSTAPPGAKGQAGGGGRHCEPPRDCGTMAPGGWLSAGSMTREAALLLFNSVHVTVSTICRISFACAQARIETE